MARALPTTDRDAFEEAIANMMSNPEMLDVSFYSFIIAKCRVHMTPEIGTCGVNFVGNSYNLHIGSMFKQWTLEERIAVLVHESRHILSGHIFRQGERNHELFNMASDIAMNDLIKNLPEGVLYSKTFSFPKGLTSEQYYELLMKEKEKQEKEKKEHEDKNGKSECSSCGGSGEQPATTPPPPKEEDEDGQGKPKDDSKDDSEEGSEDGSQDGSGGSEEQNEPKEGQGQGEEQEERTEPCQSCGGTGSESGWKPSSGNPDITGKKEHTVDNHKIWEQTDKDSEDLGKTIAEKMAKDAMSNTARGHLPGDMENLLALLKREPKVSWKKEMRQILSSKRGKRTATIKKRDRRFPHRSDLRGKRWETDKHEIVVGVDTSGSMSDQEILDGLVEIYAVAKMNGTDLKVIQIDTEIKSIEEFGTKNQTFARRGYGGTYMGAIVPFMKKEKLEPDVLIMLSDMYIEDVSNDDNWASFKPKVLWLSSSKEIPEWNGYKNTHKVIDFQNM